MWCGDAGYGIQKRRKSLLLGGVLILRVDRESPLAGLEFLGCFEGVCVCVCVERLLGWCTRFKTWDEVCDRTRSLSGLGRLAQPDGWVLASYLT